VYQRAKKVLDTVPFGTQADVYRVGYEWIGHSLSATSGGHQDEDLRVNVGSSQCTRPYSASVFNISAMSFGALSQNAILALNGGAKLSGFVHNTGEGGISPYHLKPGGSLVWQIGTGYFGCRTEEGKFCPSSFAKQATKENVKMIEIKLSQGAKPGHGGILPAIKNTEEIAKIRHVKPGTQVNSPPTHSAFSNPVELAQFIGQLRKLSGGKPIGFKLCIGRPEEFFAICRGFLETNITPDFITVDGGEGGTGAAPLEYSNSIGMPLRDALAFVVDTLNGFDLKKDIKIIASGKILTGFHLVKNFALGADLCYSARGMMLALGCIQALECNTNNCPTGVATQDPRFVKGLDVGNKTQRVANFHDETVKSVAEIISSVGLTSPSQLHRQHIFRRVSASEVKTYEDIFPSVKKGEFLKDKPESRYARFITNSSSESFASNESRICV
ncbi:UNVERIFIED_CONTAM: hypothetical protein GTU68_028709, partial [Idotea baltica]|nr:hypothetical protein [Idotea baltica]